MLSAFTSSYLQMPENMQMGVLSFICNIPTFLVFILFSLSKFEKWGSKDLIIRLGIAFSLGAMMGDFIFHICIEVFSSILSHDHHGDQGQVLEHEDDHADLEYFYALPLLV